MTAQPWSAVVPMALVAMIRGRRRTGCCCRPFQPAPRTTCTHGARLTRAQIGRGSVQVAVYDLLFGRRLQCAGPLRRFVRRYEQQLHLAGDALAAELGIASTRDLPPDDGSAAGAWPEHVLRDPGCR